jgi:hypothetical protein
LQTLARRGPRLAWEAVRQRRPILLGAAIDLIVPPLSLLVLFWLAAFAGAAAFAYCGGGLAPLIVSASGGVLLAIAVAVLVVRFGDGVSPWTLVAAVPRYVVGKIPIYVTFVFRRQRVWVRTDRDSAGTPPPHRSPLLKS